MEMTTMFLALAASVIPATPLIWGHFGAMAAMTNAALVLCVVALWFERERTEPNHHPVPCGEETRLAA
jgi:hypothetical protein